MKCMTVTWILAFSFLGTAVSASAQTFEFKGLTLGTKSSIQVLEATHGLKCEERGRSQYGIPCRGPTTLFGKNGTLEVNLSNENVITRIYVRHQSDILKFKDMRQTFYEKFGRSQSQSAYSDDWRKGQGKVEQQWMRLTPEILEMRIVRMDSPKNPAFLLNKQERKDY